MNANPPGFMGYGQPQAFGARPGTGQNALAGLFGSMFSAPQANDQNSRFYRMSPWGGLDPASIPINADPSGSPFGTPAGTGSYDPYTYWPAARNARRGSFNWFDTVRNMENAPQALSLADMLNPGRGGFGSLGGLGGMR